MIDRSQTPPIFPVGGLKLPTFERLHLSHEVPVYGIPLGTQDILKIEVIFRAGRPYEQQPLIARATASLLKEGSAKYSSAEIADQIDFYGGTLDTPVSLDHSSYVLYTLTRHAKELIPILADLLTQPVFPQRELDTFIESNAQRLEVDLAKNDILAYRKITEHIFGNSHPYGYNSVVDMYRGLERDQLVQHHQRLYHRNNIQILISGHYDDAILKLLDDHLVKALPTGKAPIPHVGTIQSGPSKAYFIQADSLQTAIRLGKVLFKKDHPDYAGFYVLNTVLGGYFGSRLMMNIREEKAYTYNIYSMIDAMCFDGCFYIGAEVKNESAQEVLSEIAHEMKILRQDLISEDELEMVRNYLLGNMLTMLDGAFNVAEIVKTIITEDLSDDYFDHLAETVRTISAKELRDLAQKYLGQEDLLEVVVGP